MTTLQAATSTTTTQDTAFQVCINPDCRATYSVTETLVGCTKCGSLLDIEYDWNRLVVPESMSEFEARWQTRRNPLDFSGVWRFRDLLPFASESSIVTIGEGQTMLRASDRVGAFVGMSEQNLLLQYEGLNPSGSFKDNGMTAASTHAHMVGAKYAACASTGNTSASLAIYSSAAGVFNVVVFVGSGKIAFGKLSQALDYGAHTLQLLGDFDDALKQVREVCQRENIYLCNSVNPFRLEGQKTIMYRVLESLNWQVPDWIVVPGGNLGNSSAFGKAFLELKELGLINRIPRLAVINAAGSNTLYQLYEQQGVRWNDGRPDMATIDGFFSKMDADNRRASTLATAIEINRPVNLIKCLRALDACHGVVREVCDEAILDAKAQIGAGGFGCEPASAASVAGAKLLREEGVISSNEQVVCILTGHQLKDPNATVAYHSSKPGSIDAKLSDAGISAVQFPNAPVVVENEIERILEAIHSFN
jgi:threonine synthase